MKKDKYWINRANKRMSIAHRNADDVTTQLLKAYNDSIKRLNNDMDKILLNFAKSGSMTVSETLGYLNERISQKRIDEIRSKVNLIKDKEMRQECINQLNAQAYKARITRIQALKEDIYIESKCIADVELRASTSFYVKQMKESYYRTIFDVCKGIGKQIDFAKMPKRKIEEVLMNNWSGKHYSRRIWRNSDMFAKKLEQTILEGFMSGKNSSVMAKNMVEYVKEIKSDVDEQAIHAKYVSERLLRTETTYITTQADLAASKEIGIEKVKFVATLDTRTSKECQEKDGSIIELKNAVIGKNAPPLHSWCRSVIINIIDGLESTVRFARDKNEKPIQVPASMKYGEWYEMYIK